MNHLGIDPGLKGALALLDSSGRLLELADTPTLKAGNKNIHDRHALFALLRDWMRRPTDGRVEHYRVAIEVQQAMPKQGRTSMFNLGIGYALPLMAITALGAPLEEIRPPAWKRVMGIPPKSDKGVSISRAASLWPEAELHGPKGGPKDGRADALLIAEAGRRINLGSQ